MPDNIGTCQICDRVDVPIGPLHPDDPATPWVCLACAELEWAEPGDGLTGDGEPRKGAR